MLCPCMKALIELFASETCQVDKVMQGLSQSVTAFNVRQAVHMDLCFIVTMTCGAHRLGG
jgi:hypothetical protein